MSDVISVEAVKKLTADQVIIFQKALDERAFELGINAYASGKVYKFINKVTGEVLYVGTTKRELKHRRAGHLSFFKKCPDAVWTMYVMAIGGPQMIEMVLIELYPCRSKAELEEREAHWIRLLNPICNSNLRAPLADVDTVAEEEDVSREYANIQSICETEARAIDASLDDARLRERLQLEKYWFDNVISQNSTVSETVRAEIFDHLSDDSHRRLFLNIWSERHLETDELLRLNPYREEMLTKDTVTQIQAMCNKLGLSSSHDQDVQFTEQHMMNHKTDLQEIVDNLRQPLEADKDADKSKATNAALALKNNIGVILEKFSGVSLQTHRERHRHCGKMLGYNSYSVAVDDDYIRNVISLVCPVPT